MNENGLSKYSKPSILSVTFAFVRHTSVAQLRHLDLHIGSGVQAVGTLCNRWLRARAHVIRPSELIVEARENYQSFEKV